MTLIDADWIAADWQEGALRLWAMQDGRVLDKAVRQGVPGSDAADQASTWKPGGPVVLAAGLPDAPRVSVPVTPGGAPAHLGGSLFALPALVQDRPAGVIVGAAAPLAGFLAASPDWDGVIVLPGGGVTHWVQISAGEAVSFLSAATGMLAGGLTLAEGAPDGAAFEQAVADTLSKPEMLAVRLAGLRAEIDALPVAPALGALIGAELAAARAWWLGQQVAVVGTGAMAGAYANALSAQGAPVTLADGEGMTLAGLYAAYRALKIPG